MPPSRLIYASTFTQTFIFYLSNRYVPLTASTPFLYHHALGGQFGRSEAIFPQVSRLINKRYRNCRPRDVWLDRLIICRAHRRKAAIEKRPVSRTPCAVGIVRTRVAQLLQNRQVHCARCATIDGPRVCTREIDRGNWLTGTILLVASRTRHYFPISARSRPPGRESWRDSRVDPSIGRQVVAIQPATLHLTFLQRTTPPGPPTTRGNDISDVISTIRRLRLVSALLLSRERLQSTSLIRGYGLNNLFCNRSIRGVREFWKKILLSVKAACAADFRVQGKWLILEYPDGDWDNGGERICSDVV